jgi:hypothetical protein
VLFVVGCTRYVDWQQYEMSFAADCKVVTDVCMSPARSSLLHCMLC